MNKLDEALEMFPIPPPLPQYIHDEIDGIAEKSLRHFGLYTCPGSTAFVAVKFGLLIYAHRHLFEVCDVCGGTGTPASERPCICGGTGRLSQAAVNMRVALFDAQKEIDRLNQLLSGK